MKFAICLIYIKITELVLGIAFLKTEIIKTNYTVFTKISFFLFVEDDSILASGIYLSERQQLPNKDITSFLF